MKWQVHWANDNWLVNVNKWTKRNMIRKQLQENKMEQNQPCMTIPIQKHVLHSSNHKPSFSIESSRSSELFIAARKPGKINGFTIFVA